MKTKLNKMLSTLKEEEKNLRTAILDGETKEIRMEAQEALDKVLEKIAEINEIIADLDQPAEEPARNEEQNEEGRSFNYLSSLEMRNGNQTDKAGKHNAEERAQSFADSGRMSIPASEARSTLISTGTIAKPTGVGGINDPFNTISSIVDMVKVEDMSGMGGHQEAFVTAWQTADALTDGTAPTATDPTFKTCVINPFLLGCVSYVSRELKKQTPLQYEAKVREGALIALKKKLSNWIVNGNGSTQIYGIVNAVNTDSSAIYTTFDMTAAIDADTLRKIVFTYGGDENIGANATLILNKQDLIAFGDVRGTNEKKAVYEIIPDGSNPNRGIIKDGGLSVPYVICSDVTSYAGATGTSSGVKTMIYGDLNNYKLGLFGNYEVNVSEDYKFAEGLLTVRGEVMVGGNVVVDKGFVVVTKKTASAG